MFSAKVVIITGAGSGIGLATAIEFSKHNANLVIADINLKNLESCSEQCEKVSPDKLKPLIAVADINNESNIEEMVKGTIKHFNKIDVLVNNAGILESGTIETTSLKQYDRVMGINVRGPYYLTMLVVPHLIETKGNIVNTSSVVGIRSFPNILAYCMSKASLDQFTRCVALELGEKGVRVNAVNPGVITTGIQMKSSMNEQQYAEFMKNCANTHALRRAGVPQEVASVICFLASDGASNITGATVPVDGGRHAMCPR